MRVYIMTILRPTALGWLYVELKLFEPFPGMTFLVESKAVEFVPVVVEPPVYPQIYRIPEPGCEQGSDCTQCGRCLADADIWNDGRTITIDA